MDETTKPERAEREARLARRLRENLRRRKAPARPDEPTEKGAR